MQSAGIYFHIPFCRAKCNYCDFYSVVDQDDNIAKFIESMILEIDRFKLDTSDWEFNSIYIGGGTPNMLNAFYIEKIISSLDKKYDLSKIKEFSIEVNERGRADSVELTSNNPNLIGSNLYLSKMAISALKRSSYIQLLTMENQ